MEYAPLRRRRTRLWRRVLIVSAIVIYVPLLVVTALALISGTWTVELLWTLLMPMPFLGSPLLLILLASRDTTMRDNPLTWTQNL